MKKILFALLTVSIVFLASCNNSKKDEPKSSEDSTPQAQIAGTVTDICGNEYPYVKFGAQYWMAENMRCNKYDTKSERAGKTITQPLNENYYEPFYNTYSNFDKSTYQFEEFSKNIKPEHIAKFGYYYNWAAAVGFATAKEAGNQTTDFIGDRQGICPNGWRIPTMGDWTYLETYIEDTDKKGAYNAGKHLKSVTGWYSNGNDYNIGTDTYLFNALPAGIAAGYLLTLTGGGAYFWSANAKDKTYVRCIILYHHSKDLTKHTQSRNEAISVRCVKN